MDRNNLSTETTIAEVEILLLEKGNTHLRRNRFPEILLMDLREQAHVASMVASNTPPNGMNTVLAVGALEKELLLAAPAMQVCASGALMGLGKILEIAQAAPASQLLGASAD